MLKRIYIIISCWLSFQCAYTQCDPGMLPEGPIYACEDVPFNMASFGAEVFSGCVLSYVMLDNSAGVFINVIDTNNNGIFEKGEAEFDVPYYLYAVTGVDEDKDGFADLDHPDTQTSDFTEVTFLENNPFELDYTCDENNGNIILQLNKASIFTTFILDGAFVLHHSFGTDTLDVDGEPLNLKLNTTDLNIELLNQTSNYCYSIKHEELLEQACYFDLALQLKKVDNLLESFAKDDTVSLNIEVLNQGTLMVADIELVTYLPPGFTMLNSNWFLNDKETEAILFVDEALRPDTSLIFQVDLLVSEDVIQGTFVPAAEIVSFQSMDGTFLTDVDSFADRDATNDLVVDNKIDDPMNDEDDHDICEVQIVLDNTSKFPIVDEIDLLSITPNPADDLCSVNYLTKNIEPVTLTIYNINGQAISTFSQTSNIPYINSFMINVSHYPAGIYLINLSTEEKTITNRFVKQ